LEALPPGVLGATLFAAVLIAYVARAAFGNTIVSSAPIADQPRLQFVFDGLLFCAAGLLAAVFNYAVYHFPLAAGVNLMTGFIAAAFFIALDMALARERIMIQQAAQQGHLIDPPTRFYPMTRKFFLIAMVTAVLVTVIIGMVIAKDVAWLANIGGDVAMDIAQARWAVEIEIFFIMAVLLMWVVNLIYSYAGNLNLLFQNETSVLERVTQGDLSQMVPVATHDEFGAIAGYTNTMISGLRHRFRLIAALKLAEEVQQDLLPQAPPQKNGLDLAGISIYCDETGGDYYDFIDIDADRIALVVADASDHGVGAALHMTTARAFLLFGVQHYPGPDKLLTEVNRFLAKDSEATGRFMSMFYLQIDLRQKRLSWVRAGHDPAILYDPAKDRFQDLNGDGVVLGVVDDYVFETSMLQSWSPGAIVLIGTDGIHESRNAQGELFGRERIKQIIKQHADQSAEQIKTAVVGDVDRFRGEAAIEDDLTLVVARLL